MEYFYLLITRKIMGLEERENDIVSELLKKSYFNLTIKLFVFL